MLLNPSRRALTDIYSLTSYIPYTPETANVLSCGIPITLDASKEFKNKKVVLVAVPGAFTPTCTANREKSATPAECAVVLTNLGD